MQFERARRELEARLEEARGREQGLRQQLAARGEQARAREGDASQMATRLGALQDANTALERERDGLAVALAQQACAPAGGGSGGGGGGGGGGGAAAAGGGEAELVELAQLRQACATLQRERDQLTDDLAPFTRSFFEEIEDLKYNYSVALQRVDEYAQRFGALGGAR